jgi:hypothetical protein
MSVTHSLTRNLFGTFFTLVNFGFAGSSLLFTVVLVLRGVALSYEISCFSFGMHNGSSCTSSESTSISSSSLSFSLVSSFFTAFSIDSCNVGLVLVRDFHFSARSIKISFFSRLNFLGLGVSRTLLRLTMTTSVAVFIVVTVGGALFFGGCRLFFAAGSFLASCCTQTLMQCIGHMTKW